MFLSIINGQLTHLVQLIYPHYRMIAIVHQIRGSLFLYCYDGTYRKPTPDFLLKQLHKQQECATGGYTIQAVRCFIRDSFELLYNLFPDIVDADEKEAAIQQYWKRLHRV